VLIFVACAQAVLEFINIVKILKLLYPYFFGFCPNFQQIKTIGCAYAPSVAQLHHRSATN